MNPLIERFERMLADGTDNALLRFGLGQAYAREDRHAQACTHLEVALVHDPRYSAAWKLLAGSYQAQGREEEALRAYRQGIAVAEERGDKQAAREMRVFLRRLQKARDGKA